MTGRISAHIILSRIAGALSAATMRMIRSPATSPINATVQHFFLCYSREGTQVLPISSSYPRTISDPPVRVSSEHRCRMSPVATTRQWIQLQWSGHHWYKFPLVGVLVCMWCQCHIINGQGLLDSSLGVLLPFSNLHTTCISPSIRIIMA